MTILILSDSTSYDTDNPLYTDTRYNNKICYNDNLTVTISHKLCRNIELNTSKKQMFWIFLREAILTNIQNICSKGK